METWTAASVVVTLALVPVPSLRPLTLSVTLVTSGDYDKDNKIRLRAVHRSPDNLTAEENPGTSARRPSNEGFATIHRLKWGPLPPNRVSKITRHVSKEEGRKKGKLILPVVLYGCKVWSH